jgi:hypothetical protein
MSQPVPSGDPTHPYPAHLIVDEKIATEITGLTYAQQKRARFDGLLPFYRHRGHKVLYRVGDLYAYRDAMFVPTKRRPAVKRKRTPEHNEKIGIAVKAAKAKKAAVTRDVS